MNFLVFMISRKKLGGGKGGRFQYVCRGEICKSIRNENSILRYDRSSRIFFFLGGLVSSSSARYSNFVYDNIIREIIIFVTIVTEKKKIYMARSLYCRIIGLSFADKNCLYNLGKYHLRKGRNERKTFRGKSSQRYRLVVFFLSRTLTFPWPFHVRIQLSGFRLFLE